MIAGHRITAIIILAWLLWVVHSPVPRCWAIPVVPCRVWCKACDDGYPCIGCSALKKRFFEKNFGEGSEKPDLEKHVKYLAFGDAGRWVCSEFDVGKQGEIFLL